MSLYPRNPGKCRDMHARAKAEAHRLLDRAKAGEQIDAERITWALRITGDLEG